jgi:hypothetical protein
VRTMEDGKRWRTASDGGRQAMQSALAGRDEGAESYSSEEEGDYHEE